MIQDSASGDIHERNAVSGYDWAGIAAAWPAWLEFSLQKSGHVKGTAPQSLAAEVDRVREIGAAFIFGYAPSDVHLPGSGLGKIEDDKSGKDFLEDRF